MSECRFLKSVAMILRGVLRMIDDRLAACCGTEERPKRVVLIGRSFIPVTDLKEYFAVAQEITGLRIRGDVLAYVSAGPVSVLNGKGAPMNPQPAPASLGVSQNGLEDFYIAADGRAVIMGSDAKAPDDAWDAKISCADGDADDFNMSGSYDPDAATTVDGGALGELSAITSPDDLPPRA